MKILLLALLLISTSLFADTTSESEEMEVGTPKDCTDLGKTNDQGREDERLELQHKITDCLGPEEEEAKTEVVEKTRKVVSQ
jgi:hypothetical protein